MTDNHVILGTKYVGGKADGYDAKRENKKKWKDEHDFIHRVMAKVNRGSTVLDCPVGTGRLLRFLDDKKLRVTGVDSSQDMVDYAAKLKTKAKLQIGDATKMPEFADKSFDVVICLRLLHLVEESTMQKIVKELSRVADHTLILSIQIRDGYSEGEDTATHDSGKFRGLLRRLGWEVAEEKRLTGAGWYMMHLTR